ncbi:hypothetical protein L2E82_06507 [Cichorium intybus]|uniref:Uncharacterized protein n=1 Tax=Cichorium intybus TaxID=13427 RepID=A0ACB9HA84_CICIN|nr:hypothetical protein L2E82_06507 [Cichorium intybus]
MTTARRPPAALATQKYGFPSVSSASNRTGAVSRVLTSPVTDKTKQSSNFRHPFHISSTEFPTSNSSMYPDLPFPCLSSGNYSVIAMLTGSVYPGYVPPNCKVMKSVVLPVRPNVDIRVALELMWFTPYCKTSEREGKACELKTDDVQTIGVSISRSGKYGLGIDMSVLALICISGLAYYASSKVQGHNDSDSQGIGASPVANITQLPDSGTGLDGPTIESYPKTVFGESSQLPNVDATCAICLSDYKHKELLRTIPECNHYFHVECIDEWLKLNMACPMCRNTP